MGQADEVIIGENIAPAQPDEFENLPLTTSLKQRNEK